MAGVDPRDRHPPAGRAAGPRRRRGVRHRHSSIVIARAFPDATVHALGVDATSIERARTNVAAAGLTERVRPDLHDASAPDMGGPYDLVTIFEALHDMSHPVEALRTARTSLAPGGSVVIADERVADRFAPPGDELERVNYGFSVLHCLAVGLLDESSAGTGTVIVPTPCGATPPTPASAASKFCPSSTTSGASTGSSRDERRGPTSRSRGERGRGLGHLLRTTNRELLDDVDEVGVLEA